ncbi:MAG: AsmA family protein [Planctomycetota bacterium]
MKKLKIILLILLIPIVLLIGLIIAGFIFIDSVAKHSIEQGASYALAVPTTLDSADIGVFTGEFGLEGLTISNPEGYNTPHFFRLDSGGAALDVASVKSDTIELPSLTLTGIEIYLDKEDGKANYETILDNLKRFESGEAPPEDTAPSEQPGQKLVIRKLEIRDVTAHVEFLPLGGDALSAEVKVPEIILEDVGETDPVTVATLTSVILKAIFASVINVGGDVLPAGVLDGLSGGLGELSDLAGQGIGVAVDLGEGLVSVVGDVGGIAGDAVEGATDAVGDAAEELGSAAEDAVGRVGNSLGGLLGGGGGDDDQTPPTADDDNGGG